MTTTTEAMRLAREALAFYADESRYHGPNQPIKVPDKWSEEVGLSAYRLDVTGDHGVIASKALAAIDAIPQHDAQPNCHSTRPDVAPPSRPDDYCTDIQCRVMGRCRYAAPAADIDEAQLARLSERGAVAWAGVDAQALREGVCPAGSRPQLAPT